MAAALTILYSSHSLFTLSLQLLFHVFVFFHRGLHHVQSQQRYLSTCLEAWYFSTYRAGNVRLLPQQAAASGILPCHTTLCVAIFHAFRSWLASKPHSSLSLLTVSPAWRRSTRTRPTPTRDAWSLSRKRQQLPMVTIIRILIGVKKNSG